MVILILNLKYFNTFLLVTKCNPRLLSLNIWPPISQQTSIDMQCINCYGLRTNYLLISQKRKSRMRLLGAGAMVQDIIRHDSRFFSSFSSAVHSVQSSVPTLIISWSQDDRFSPGLCLHNSVTRVGGWGRGKSYAHTRETIQADYIAEQDCFTNHLQFWRGLKNRLLARHTGNPQ